MRRTPHRKLHPATPPSVTRVLALGLALCAATLVVGGNLGLAEHYARSGAAVAAAVPVTLAQQAAQRLPG